EKKGEKKAKEETAVNLMRIGTDVKIISQATGLSQKKIKQLALRSEGSEK
ncbi:MAG: transposase, partial [Desulfobacterales bacterium]|nr:transposase [Desulfobacterales bacterium]